MTEKSAVLALGIDIGTTTVSAAVMDLTHGREVTSRTVESAAWLPAAPDERVQDDRGAREQHGRAQSVWVRAFLPPGGRRAAALAVPEHSLGAPGGSLFQLRQPSP